MAPILSFTAEEVWQYLPGGAEKAGSVHHTEFPVVQKEYLDDALNERWDRIWEIRTVVMKALEEARKEKKIGLSLDAKVHLHLPQKEYSFLQPYEKELKSIFIVSSVALLPQSGGEKGVRAEVLRADGEKCERCWNYDVSVGKDQEHPAACGRCIEALRE
jgi:isoleucyl-tRNA synthetase